MTSHADYPTLGSDDFTRRYAVRSKNLMWFLGAGASASAGIPTAWDMIWEFKQRLFVSQRKVPFQAVSDLSNKEVRARLQAHIDSSDHLPAPGSPEEYAALFEAVYPAEADRRSYLDSKMSGAKPSYGHFALATLMRAGLSRIAWTTNFDSMLADACAKVYDTTGSLTTVALDAPEQARQTIADERWPVEIKLHGDFRSRRLKNTSDELREQQVELRRLVVESSQRFGLVVIGYSGRDNSVMETLEQALGQAQAFPAGLFWLHRGEDEPLPRVCSLLREAAASGVEATVVQIENFDEVLRDIVRLLEGLDIRDLDQFAAERSRCGNAPLLSGRTSWPVLRLNALPIDRIPSQCRRVVCDIGGYREVREAIEKADVDVLAARKRAGVLAFGSDSEVRKAFGPFDIREFDLFSIESKRLRYDSGERGLLRDALGKALAREHHLDRVKRRTADLLTPRDDQSEAWLRLRGMVGALSGTVRNTPELTWREGVGIRLAWASDRLWLLIEPRTVFEGLTEANRGAAADFARERTVKRYNRELNQLLDFWSRRLAAGGKDLYALGISDGVDAVFSLSELTGFSWRVGA